MSTGIEWTDETWNPTTGCDQVSPGCDNCYALTMAARLKGMGQAKYQTDGDPRTSGPGFGLAMHDDALSIPLRWRKPRKVFVNSMSDLFHPKVTDEFIGRVFNIMGLADRHTFQVLTKRPKRMRSFLKAYYPFIGVDEPYPNVWLGTSVEDQQRADERIPALIDTPAAVRFLSCEPLLGWTNIYRWLRDGGIHWVIAGGESGPGARPMERDWAANLRDECVQTSVAFHFKQWGAHDPGSGARVGKKAAGRLLDGRTWDEFPEAVSA